MLKIQLSLLILVLIASSAFASPITTLYDTGLASPTSADPNWTVNGSTAFVTNNAGFPFGPWQADSTTSRWISPQASYVGGQTDTPGTYTYATTFNLAGYVASTASISFSWAVDNSISDVLVNGVSMGHTFPVPTSFTFQPSVTIPNTFLAGVNTLQFVTINAAGASGNPAGLRIEFTSDATLTTVPEPGTLTLIGAAFF